jgi:ketosteroid isomerase-like protein
MTKMLNYLSTYLLFLAILFFAGVHATAQTNENGWFSGTFPEDTYSLGSQERGRKSATMNGPNERLISDYYAQNLKIFQAHSTKADIYALFENFTEDFTYTHMGYGGLYSREELYQGYLRNQQNGDYNGQVADFQVTEKMLGRSAIVVKRRYITLEAGQRLAGDAQMTLFEFRGGKISRIVEYW